MRHVLSRFDDHAVFEPMLGVMRSSKEAFEMLQLRHIQMRYSSFGWAPPTLTSTICFMHIASLDTLGVNQGRVQTTRGHSFKTIVQQLLHRNERTVIHDDDDEL